MKTGIELITEERIEQIIKHGKSLPHDKEANKKQQLRVAAQKLINNGSPSINEAKPPFGWDQEIWDKMRSKTNKEKLIIAGALIAAEIDRINDLAVVEPDNE